MLIIGAKGFAKEVLETLHQNNRIDNLSFFDDLNEDNKGLLFSRFPIIKNLDSVKKYFQNIDSKYTIGVGGPESRRKLYYKFSNIGGKFTTTISPTAVIGHYGNIIGEGCNIMINVVITNDIKIGRGSIINQITSIGHDVTIGEFCEICPNVSISGNCTIGNNVFVGTGAIILPKIIIGTNVIIGAGAVVSKDLPDNCVAVGIPAKVIKRLEPLNDIYG